MKRQIKEQTINGYRKRGERVVHTDRQNNEYVILDKRAAYINHYGVVEAYANREDVR